jgi:integrase
LAKSLEDELNEPQRAECTWDEFDRRYRGEHLTSLSEGSAGHWRMMAGLVVEILRPVDLVDVDSDALSRLAQALRSRGVRETTIASYMGTLRAGLSWAERIGMLEKVPRYVMPRRSRGASKIMRSRPITAEEFERMVSVIPRICRRHAAEYAELLEVLFWSGLRLNEALRLSWVLSADFAVWLGSEFPFYRIRTEGEKGHKDRLLPIAPEFGRWLLDVPPERRKGRVLAMRHTKRNCQKWIRRIATAAGVIVSGDGKVASAQDFRRAFGTRWARRLRPAELRELMRHESIETTMRFYVEIDAHDLASQLWRGSDNNMSAFRAN